MNLWDLAKTKYEEYEDKAAKLEQSLDEEVAVSEIKRRHESHIIVCGSADSGKSTIISKLQDKNEPTEPTIAMEYTYVRRTRGLNRDVVHIWELSGGTKFTNLLNGPLSIKNIEVASMVLCLDLTKPAEIWNIMEKILETSRKIIEEVMGQINKTKPIAYDNMIAAMKNRIEGYKEDLKMCSPFPIPLIIYGMKYDEFQNYDSDMRRHLCTFLRFIAHYYGAHLVLHSNRMEKLVRLSKTLLGHLAFSSTLSKGLQIDHNKPLHVLSGTDSFESIGLPPLDGASFTRSTQPIELWKTAFHATFTKKDSETLQIEDPSIDPLFKESLIDNMVEQKQRDLEQYVKHKKDRQAAERRAAAKLSLA